MAHILVVIDGMEFAFSPGVGSDVSALTRQANRFAWKASNLLWEYRLGISTRGRDGESDAEHKYYATTPHLAIFQILDSLSLGPSDVVVDLGAGKGRVVCCAATYKIARAIGIEESGTLHQMAQANALHLRGKRAPISLLRGRAQAFDYTIGTVFYLFNPFGPETLRQVLEKLKDGINSTPRPVRIVYVNPLHDEILAQSGWLRHDTIWQPRGLTFPVSIWKSDLVQGSVK